MDKALQARKLGSAAARRQRIAERQLERERELQQRSRHRRQVMSEIIALEASDSESESQSQSSSNAGHDSAAETASESDVRTPEDTPYHDMPVTLSPTAYNTTLDTMSVKSLTRESNMAVLRPQSRPKMQATLTTVADWNYDRYSILIDPNDAEELAERIAEEEESSSLSSEGSDEEQEECSPIEIATPVLYTMPRMKPAVVSITSTQGPTKLVTIETTVRAPKARKYIFDQMIVEPPQEAFKAGEAKLFRVSNSSHESIESTTNSSHPSRSMSIISQNDSIISRSVSQTSNNSYKSPKRKSSLPLLFGSGKSGHSRMSSIKKLIRTSTLGPPASPQPFIGTLHRYPSGSALETHFESRDSSVDEPRRPLMTELKRPMTARVPSPALSLTNKTVVFPVAYPTRTPIESESRPSSKGSDEIQIKPVSRFRQRSGSIGQALKSMGNVSKKADASAPPVPVLLAPSAQQMLKEQRYPTPPPLTPRDPRRNTNYSPFPFVDKRVSSANVGLGLRY